MAGGKVGRKTIMRSRGDSKESVELLREKELRPNKEESVNTMKERESS